MQFGGEKPIAQMYMTVGKAQFCVLSPFHWVAFPLTDKILDKLIQQKNSPEKKIQKLLKLSQNMYEMYQKNIIKLFM